jgi:hypothetical protein
MALCNGTMTGDPLRHIRAECLSIKDCVFSHNNFAAALCKYRTAQDGERPMSVHRILLRAIISAQDLRRSGFASLKIGSVSKIRHSETLDWQDYLSESVDAISLGTDE